MQLFMISQADLTEIPDLMAIVGAPRVFAVAVALQRPRSRGRLSLISPDPRTQPRIELNYLDHPEDMSRMVDGVRLAWRVAQWPAIARHAEHIAVLTEEMTASDELLRGYLQMTVSTIYHPVGTARMGPDGEAGAVVDQRGRVRGVDGLAVVDASIMPNVPRANTNLHMHNDRRARVRLEAGGGVSFALTIRRGSVWARTGRPGQRRYLAALRSRL